MTEPTAGTVPALDTIDFEQLVEVARAEIPRHAPDWTDHNPHDPGMTVVDLLAWIVDQQVYRAGHVGRRHLRAFAALLGRRAAGPVPAGGLVWPDAPVPDGRTLPGGTPVVCPLHPELGFSLDVAHDLYLPPARLTGIELDHGGVGLPAADGSWVLDERAVLRFDGPLGAAVPARISLGVEVVPPPGPAPAPDDPPWGPVRYAHRSGTGPWVRLDVVSDGTAGLARTGVVVLAIPPGDPARGPSALRLDRGRGVFPVAPQIRAVAPGVLPVVQRTRVAPATLGDGTGLPDQRVELDATDLLETPRILVGYGVAEREWEQQPDLTRSGPHDRHHLVRPDHVRFGNGVNGRCPTGPIRHGELFRTRGADGNLRRGLTWTVPALGPEPVGRNRQALSGGTGPTTPDELARATRRRAVDRAALLTDDELAAAVRGLTGLAVARADVLAGFDHRLGDRRAAGVRTVVVLPHQPDGERVRPPTQAYLDAVAARLAPRRVLGERLVVRGPVVVAVDVAVAVLPEPGATDVAAAVVRAVRRLLAAIAGPGSAPWPLGRDLSVLDVESAAVAVPQVARVVSARIGAAGTGLGTDPVPVPRDGLVAPVAVRVTVEEAGR